MDGTHESVGSKPDDQHIEQASHGDSAAEKSRPGPSKPATNGKRALIEADEYVHLGYSFPTWRKWMILTIMFLVQISINLNASLYANAVEHVSEKFSVSKQAAPPWSEELGRWPTQQLSLLLVNIWQLPCAFAPNYATLVVCRLLGGLSTAGGSVTLGVLADMWEPDDQEYAIAYLVLSSVGGSVVGAVVGGFVEARHELPWIFWTQLIAGGAVQIMHFFLVPETRSTIILDRLAKKRRKAGEDVYGPNEVKEHKMTFKEIMVIWSRPFYMLITEPIVAWLSAVSGFSDNLIFIFLQGFQPVYKQWGFGTVSISLAFIPLLVGYVLAYLSFLLSIHMFRQRRRKHGSDSVSPEARLWWLRYVIMFEPIGLIGFAWSSLGPKHNVHWIAPMIFSSLVGVANYSIYQSSIDYTVAAYGVYAASATGGNDFARDFLSGIAAIYSGPMYEKFGSRPLEYASTFLAIFALLVCTPVFYFYKHGPEIRKRSKFAAEIEKARKEGRGGRPKTEGEEPTIPGREKV
ncbi:MFS general substrate transporter [Xylariaceae sp. FL0016]|nr:MFS general substrate transporter [Xylariaceae sp. FL0016]